MSKPMPSPRGTNLEGLYLADRRGAAYDAAGGLSAESLKAVIEFLADKLSPEDLEEAKRVLGDPEVGMDDPPDFRGKPVPGGRIVGMDGKVHDISHLSPRIRAHVYDVIVRQKQQAERDYYRRYPEAARLGRDRYPARPGG